MPSILEKEEPFEASGQLSSLGGFIFTLHTRGKKREDKIGADYLLFVHGIMILFATCQATSGFSLNRRMLYSYHLLP